MKLLSFVEHYATEKGDELTDWVPVRREPDEGWTPALELDVKDVQQGDILHVMGKVQRTNNLHKSPWSLLGGRNVGFGYRIALVASGLAPIPITSWTGGNVDQARHHEPSVDGNIWRAPATYGDVLVRLYVKCASSNAVTSGPKRWLVELDRGYGHLSVLHQRPVEV